MTYFMALEALDLVKYNLHLLIKNWHQPTTATHNPISVEFTEAFDKVPHPKLQYKLQCMYYVIKKLNSEMGICLFH